MTYKAFSQFVLIVFCLVVIGKAEYTYWTHDYKAIKEVTVVNDIVTEKFESEEYACGSKKRYVCVDRYLVFDNAKVSVDTEKFTSTQIGERVHITERHWIGNTFWEGLARCIHWLLSIIFIVTTACYFFAFITWSVCYSDKMTFGQFINK